MKDSNVDIKKQFLEGTSTQTFAQYYIPQPGQNLIKIVVKGKPVIIVKEHFLKWSAVCLGQDCPICFIASKFNLDGWKARDSRMMYVADLVNPDPLIKIYSFGPSVASKLNLLVKNYEILDSKIGRAILIQRTGQGINTRYELIPKEEVNLEKIPSYLSEYEELLPLEETLNRRIEESKTSMLRNMEAILPPDVLQSVIVTLVEHKFIAKEDVGRLVEIEEETQSSNSGGGGQVLEQTSIFNLTNQDTENTTISVQDMLKELRKKK